MGPPPAQSAAPEVDSIFREAQEKSNNRSADERQMHDAMLAAIFKAVREDTVPESSPPSVLQIDRAHKFLPKFRNKPRAKTQARTLNY